MVMRLACFIIGVFVLIPARGGLAGELSIRSVFDRGPGMVVVRVDAPEPVAPPARAFRLRFDRDHTIEAVAVSPVSLPPQDTDIVVLVDRSGSMGPNTVADFSSVLQRVAAGPRPHIRLALIAFGTQTRTLSGLSNDPSQFVDELRRLKSETGPDAQTKIYESITVALSTWQWAASPTPKRIVVISDGKDEGSLYGADVVINRAKALAVAVNGVGFGRLAAEAGGSLKVMADATGGKYVLANSVAELASALDRLFSSVQPDPVLDVTFRYPPSPVGLMASSPSVEYIGTEVGTMSRPLERNIAALESPAPAPFFREWNITIFKVTFDSKFLLAGLGSLAAAILAGWLYRWVRSPKPGPTTTPTPAPPTPTPTPTPTRSRRGTQVGTMFPEPRQGRPAAILTCVNGSSRGRTFNIDQAMVRVGTGTDNQVSLTGDDYLSAWHAAIKYESGALYVSDAGSRNGTYLNETRLGQTAVALNPGDRIRVGKTTLELQMAQKQAGHLADGGERIVP